MSVAPPLDLAPTTASLDPSDFAVPNGREEQWRFVPYERAEVFFHTVADAGIVTATADTYVRMVPIGDVADGWLPTDRPGAIARANVQEAILVDIPANTVVDEPIVVHLSAGAAMNYLHLTVRTGVHSKATVIVQHDLNHDVCGAMVTHLGDGSDLTMVSIVDQGNGRNLVHWPAVVGRDARFTGAVVTLDGTFVRISPTVTYAGPGGSADLLGVFLADSENFYEHRVFVEHAVPNCRSNVVYKGALSGRDAHTVWIGDVLVRREATGTDTYEMNRNLLLTEGPRADSVPNLELETGDVAGAGHASATGRFDDSQLFYLMSRGIPEALARQLVVRGFFADVFSRIGSQEWRDRLISRVDNRLGIVEMDDE